MLLFHALPTKDVRALQAGQPDINGQPAERATSNGAGNPCRHCLAEIPAGTPMLILAYRPFPIPQPYAEVGPIFLCGTACTRFETSGNLPENLKSSPEYLIKGYTSDNRIKYGTGVIVKQKNLTQACEDIFLDMDISYIHVRSYQNNCYNCKITRG
ncbi:MAG: DUF1203 domain-containing protein [Paracoccaceae bacterium]